MVAVELHVQCKCTILVIGVKEKDPAGSRGCWDFLKRPPDMLEPPDFVKIGY